MQSIKIILACIVAAILYGIVHDEITAHVCVQYFTVFHEKIITSQSPTLLGLSSDRFATEHRDLLQAHAQPVTCNGQFGASNLEVGFASEYLRVDISLSI